MTRAIALHPADFPCPLFATFWLHRNRIYVLNVVHPAPQWMRNARVFAAPYVTLDVALNKVIRGVFWVVVIHALLPALLIGFEFARNEWRHIGLRPAKASHVVSIHTGFSQHRNPVCHLSTAPVPPPPRSSSFLAAISRSKIRRSMHGMENAMNIGILEMARCAVFTP